MKYLIVVLVLAISPPVLACVHSIEVTDNYAKICAAADSCREVVYQAIPNMNQARKNELLRSVLQQFLDTRTSLDLLEPEDPDKGSDPGCEHLYWGLSDGTPTSDPLEATHLIGRGCVVENVSYDGTQYWFTVRRAERCQ
jgi:hypothetical protein